MNYATFFATNKEFYFYKTHLSLVSSEKRFNPSLGVLQDFF